MRKVIIQHEVPNFYHFGFGNFIIENGIPIGDEIRLPVLGWAYVVGGGWELFAFLDDSRSMITLNPTPPP